MKSSACGRAIRQFYETTTLHGFKYLCSKYFGDRLGWLICCCASACCAGVLCAVLWERFLEVPALLTLHDLRGQDDAARLPLVAVCPPAETVAYLFQQKLILNVNVTSPNRLQTILSNVLRRRVAPKEHLIILEDILFKNNLSMPEALMKVMPPCHSIVRNCRWQTRMISCEKLFDKELTEWGVCCIARPSKIKVKESAISRLEIKRRLHIAVQCSDQPALIGCEFFTKYNGEEWVEPLTLTPGFNYLAQLTFTSVVDSDPDKLVDGTCSSTDGYSRSKCLKDLLLYNVKTAKGLWIKFGTEIDYNLDLEVPTKSESTWLRCKEKLCGCSDPMRSKNVGIQPLCYVTQLNCLRSINFENNTCKCLPSCKKVTTYLSLESSPLNALNDSFDEIYSGLNVTTSTVLLVSVRISGSRKFVVNPTETWITLLSSLGGVFNMFLGVGLFSALEILFLLFVRLPLALRKSTEIDGPSDAN